jgi:hypothetical protein
MALRYSHVLIPKSSEYVPSLHQVESFLALVVAEGVIGGEPKYSASLAGTTKRVMRNQFTGEEQIFYPRDALKVASLREMIAGIGAHSDYNAGVSGIGRPIRPPLPIGFQKDYHLGVTCVVSPKLCSTSCLHNESGYSESRPWFGEPTDSFITTGLFSHPNSSLISEVDGAGCARFWIEFDLGNWLFPTGSDESVELMAPWLLEAAAKKFNVGFHQGFHWG